MKSPLLNTIQSVLNGLSNTKEIQPVAYINELGCLTFYKKEDFDQCEYGGLSRLFHEEDFVAMKKQLNDQKNYSDAMRKGFCVALYLFSNTLDSEDIPEKILDFLQFEMNEQMFQSPKNIDAIIDAAIAAGRKP